MTSWFISLIMLAFVMSVTPGPNNVIFAASGGRVGFLGTLPIMVGMLVGFASVIGLCAAGIGSAVGDSKRAQILLSLSAAAYMVWLAWRLWVTAGKAAAATDSAYTSGVAMLLLQGLNPKTWLASVAFVSGFLGLNSPGGWWVDVLGVASFLAVVTISAILWTVFGASLRMRRDLRGFAVFNRFLSILAAVTALGMLRAVL
ncbi:MAG: LysE family transporter [Nocardioidaceae bacterium]|nr:LysE family transporter [Nocardioidaceae bacterium]